MENLKFWIIITFVGACLVTACSGNNQEATEEEPVSDAETEQITEPEETVAEEPAEVEPEEEIEITYTEDGSYTLQVESWRSGQKAESRAEMWRARGYENTYIVEHGEPDAGDIWFRVRIGNFGTEMMADKVRSELSSEHQTESWVTARN